MTPDFIVPTIKKKKEKGAAIKPSTDPTITLYATVTGATRTRETSTRGSLKKKKKVEFDDQSSDTSIDLV